MAAAFQDQYPEWHCKANECVYAEDISVSTGLGGQANDLANSNPAAAASMNATSAGKARGSHSVEIFGWGETPNGKKYWWGKNSWGPKWGRK